MCTYILYGTYIHYLTNNDNFLSVYFLTRLQGICRPGNCNGWVREISRHEYNLLMIVCNFQTCRDGEVMARRSCSCSRQSAVVSQLRSRRRSRSRCLPRYSRQRRPSPDPSSTRWQSLTAGQMRADSEPKAKGERREEGRGGGKGDETKA